MLQKMRRGLEGHSQRLYRDMMQGLKSFSENPGKYTVQLGKDYWDLLASVLTGYAGIKIATRTGTSYTNPVWLATEAAWVVSMFSPYLFKLEKTRGGNVSRATRNVFGGLIPAFYFVNKPPFNWIISLGCGGIGGMLSESFRHWERKRISKISKSKQKPKNLENIII